MPEQTTGFRWLGELDADEAWYSPLLLRLNHLYLVGLPVIPGSVITTGLFRQLLATHQLERRLTQALLAIDWRQPRSITSASRSLTRFITSADWSKDQRAQFDLIWQGLASQQVALTFYGQQAEPLSPVAVSSAHELAETVKRLMAAQFEASQLTAESVSAILGGTAEFNILIQPLVTPEVSGLLRTSDGLVIEAIYGRPEPLLHHQLLPDRYLIDPESTRILHQAGNRQDWYLASLAARAPHQAVPTADRSRAKLEESQIMALARLGQMVRAQSDFGLDIVWLLDQRNQFWLCEIREIAPDPLPAAPHATVLLAGQSAVPGRISGPAYGLTDMDELTNLPSGTIGLVESLDAVAEADLHRLGGIIAETGQVKHESLEALAEAGLPTIVAAKGARRLIPDGQLITLDAFTGQVIRGQARQGGNTPVQTVAQGQVIGVKLFLSADQEDQPTLADGAIVTLTDDLASQLHQWSPRPVIVSLAQETTDRDPLGYHGAHRSLAEPQRLKQELTRLSRLQEEQGQLNLELLLPHVRTIKELSELSHHVASAGLRAHRHFRLWLQVETPAGLAMLKRPTFKGLVQGICLDVDQLAQLILGIDRRHARQRETYDLCDEAVLSELCDAITAARKLGLSVMARGQSLETHPQGLEALIRAGLHAVVVSERDLADLHRFIASVEQRLIIDHARIALKS